MRRRGGGGGAWARGPREKTRKHCAPPILFNPVLPRIHKKNCAMSKELCSLSHHPFHMPPHSSDASVDGAWPCRRFMCVCESGQGRRRVCATRRRVVWV